MSYKGQYHPGPKYEGNIKNVVYRSMWEKKTFIWCDANPKIAKWSSEEICIPYQCLTDGYLHRYFVDLKITLTDGRVFLIEIKPHAQVCKPRRGTKSYWRFLKEVNTYAKNTSKWKAARRYAEEKGWVFKIWTERDLKAYGILQNFGPMRQRLRRRGKNCNIREKLEPI